MDTLQPWEPLSHVSGDCLVCVQTWAASYTNGSFPPRFCVKLAVWEGMRIWQGCLPTSLRCFEAAPIFDLRLSPLLGGAERSNEAAHLHGEGLAGSHSSPHVPNLHVLFFPLAVWGRQTQGQEQRHFPQQVFFPGAFAKEKEEGQR